MQEQEKMSKLDLLDALRFGFEQLATHKAKGSQYTPDPAKLAAMAERTRLRAEADPTILGGQTLEDIRP